MALKWVFSFVGEYWLAIILVTVAIKLVLLPLDIKQRQSSMKMQLAAGEVENIKKRYANDPNQAEKKVQEYYKKNGIKPTAGCLPMLISMVLLFAFYGALRSVVSEQTISLALRSAVEGAGSVKVPSFLWVHNVLQPDSGMAGIFPTPAELQSFIKVNASSISPQMLMMMKNEGLLLFKDGIMTVNEGMYTALTTDIITANGFFTTDAAGAIVTLNNGWFGLPIIAGGTLFLQQWLTNKTGGNAMGSGQPGGKLLLYFFPIFSAYICATSNACFAIYWTVSNIFAMGMHLIYTWVVNSKKKKEPATINSIR